MSERFIGKYEVVTTLGKGSMGVVYKARDPEIGRLVAIKTLKTMVMGDDAAGEEALQRFRQESRSAGMLHHPNIVTIFEAGKTDNGSPYIVMEHIEGASLEQRVVDDGPIAPLETLHYLAQVASAIDYAHSQNVIHRDIKPSNIIVGSDYKPFLLDFGVAKLADTSLTPAGTVVGTPSYMSPEQIRGLTLDGRTDIFSLAVVAFELFTGVRPYPGKDFTTVVTNIMHQEPRSFAELGVDLPPDLERELHHGLAKERDERFSSALAMVHSFAQVFAVLVDGSGLVGGYKPEMESARGTLEIDSASKKPTVPVTRPTLTDAPKTRERRPTNSSISRVNRQNRWLYAIGILGLLACGGFVAIAAIQKSAPAPRVESAGQSDADEVEVSGLDTSGQDLVDSSDTSDQSGVAQDGLPVKTSDDEIAAALKGLTTSVSDEVEQRLPQEPLDGFSAESLKDLSDEQLKGLAKRRDLRGKSLRAIADEFSSRGALGYLDSLLILLENDDFGVRVSALKGLRNEKALERKDVRVAVTRALQDEEYLVRGFAAKILSNSSDRTVRKALEDRLAVEQRPVVKKVLRQALAGRS